MRYIIKPLVWNTAQYKRPSGIVSQGYSAEYGFGHEEWNNSPNLIVDGLRYFYTNYIDKIADPGDSPFVQFMISSHHRVQQLVGIAGLTYVIPTAGRRPLGDKFREEAWQVDSVKNAFNKSREAFESTWEERAHLTPNSVCPIEYYFWLPEPVNIIASNITGMKRFISMFSSYQEINKKESIAIIDSVPNIVTAHPPVMLTA